MRNNILIFLIMMACRPVGMQAQYYRPENTVWAMGHLSGLDFSGPEPVPIVTAMAAGEGCASVCDEAGRLLFYTNGSRIWNASGTVMPNGSDVTGCGPMSSFSATQGALIIPAMEQCGLYYVFSLASNGTSMGLYCSRVNMNLSNGQGDVDTAYSLDHVRLNAPLSEKMIALKGRENDIWILTHADTQPRFYAYRLSVSGLDTVPVISDAGAGNNYLTGVMKANLQGNKLFTYGPTAKLTLYDFNASAGVVTNARLIDTIIGYGGVFSPDGSKLYIQCLPARILQYDLNDPDPVQTKVVVGHGVGLTDLKLAVNHKIYFKSGVGMSSGNVYMGCIESPDDAGIACHYRDSVTSLLFTQININQTRLNLGLPNDVIVGLSPPPAVNRVVSDRRLCSFPAGGISLQARSGFDGYEWDNSVSGPLRSISQPGTYWVRYNTFCGPQTDTFKIRNTGGLPPLSISYNQPVLSTNNTYTNYQWYLDGTAIPGATQASYTVTADGWYSVSVKKDTLCSDSAAYHVTGFVGINSPSPDEAITVYPNPVRDVLYVKAREKVSLSLLGPDGRLLLHAPSANSLDMKGLGGGLYFLQVYDKKGNRIRTEKVLKL
ncbi:T9SS type A sorting domain-containing protein [Taibaiella koreensis]|uniref:T9SS type A sorting domain-containing protein n=1 Tax=Taibaiella koreensis TaxID=1268548 RepID=UPI0013C32552|nr:T9SS type A sorting domain-containing protein [Taibaiella koreensis]